MRTHGIRIIAILALPLAAATAANAQPLATSYTLTGEYLRTFYTRGVQELEAGNLLVAHRFLSTYWVLEFGYGVFNDNPQFRAQVNKALNDIEAYFQVAATQQQTLRRDLQECERRGTVSGGSSRGISSSGSTPGHPPAIQLPRVPPER